MDFFGDYHTHTVLSDGKSELIENIDRAIEIGLKEIAITDHGFSNPTMYALSRKKFFLQKEKIELARIEYGDKIKIIQGIEADLIGMDGTIDLEENEAKELELLLLGYHSMAKTESFREWKEIHFKTYQSIIKKPSKATVERNTKAMISAIKRYPIDILVHINYLFKVDCFEVAKACSDYGTMLEINNKHIINFSHEVFEKILSTDVKLIVNSDAHHFSRIGNFAGAEEFLSHHNFDYNRIQNYKKKAVFERRK